MNAIKKFLKEEDGVSALEYGIMAAIVAIVLVAVVGTDKDGLLGQTFTKLFTKVQSSIPA